MAIRPETGLSLCAGGGGLDMGLELAEPGFRTACYVEWEQYPRAVLQSGIEHGYFHPAPIWSDLRTFDAGPWRGIVDTVLAGYPCQPFSQAGQRKGADDDRHLWPEVARIILECRPRWVFLENVAGHVTIGGEAVLRELWNMGWTPAAGLFSASETGAPHERLRWFCVAYRDRPERGANIGEPNARADWRHDATGGSGTLVADASVGRRAGSGEGQDQQPGRAEVERTGGDSARCDAARVGPSAECQGRQSVPGDGCNPMVNAEGVGRPEGRAGTGIRIGRNAAATGAGRDMADTGGAERQRQQPGQRDAGGWQEPDGYSALPGRTGLHPPGPGDAAAWEGILRSNPSRAPAISRRDAKTAAVDLAALFTPEQARAIVRRAGGMEVGGIIRTMGEEAPEMVGKSAVVTGFRDMAHGMAARSRALRLLGNGVHPLAAANAWRTISHAHGLRPVDLGAASGRTKTASDETWIVRAAE